MIEDLYEALSQAPLAVGNERKLQDSLEELFKARGWMYEREYSLTPKDRVDFLLDGRIGVEVKVGGSPHQVMRQLARYLDCEQVESVVLVTSRAQHASIPNELRGKPVRKYLTVWKGL